MASIGDCGSPDRGSIPLEGPLSIEARNNRSLVVRTLSNKALKNWFFLSAWIFLFFVLALQHDAFAITNSYSFSSSSVSVEQGQTSSLDLVAVKTKDSGSNAELYVQILRPEGSKIDGSNPFFTSIKVNNIDVLSDTNFSTYIFFPVVADTYSTSSISIPITFSIKQSAPAGIYTVRLVGWYDSQTILATAQLIVKSTSSQTPTSTPKTTPSTSPTQSPTIQPPTTKPAKIFGTVASPIGNMPNLTMTLKDSSGTKTTKTDDSGDYRFDNVAPGKAKLTLTIPKGYFHANTGNAVGSSSKELVVESGGKYEKNWSLFSLEESKTGGTKNPKEKISPNTKPN